MSNKMIKATLTAAVVALAPAAALAHPHKTYVEPHPFADKKEDVVEYRRGESIDGYHIPGYVFIYADRDNDGVLRGNEIGRATLRVHLEERDSDSGR